MAWRLFERPPPCFSHLRLVLQALDDLCSGGGRQAKAGQCFDRDEARNIQRAIQPFPTEARISLGFRKAECAAVRPRLECGWVDAGGGDDIGIGESGLFKIHGII